eukprot:7388329-Prymnesium_polylepis.1
MSATGLATGVIVGAVAETPWLHPNHEPCAWLGSQLKAHFEISDDETSGVLAVVTGRPNFLKTTGMLRTRRTRHPTQWETLTQSIARVFSDASDVVATAATVEERLSTWLDDEEEASAEQEPQAHQPPPVHQLQADVPPVEQPTDVPVVEQPAAEEPPARGGAASSSGALGRGARTAH